jgi:sugar phosphate isomerase/epimerase
VPRQTGLEHLTVRRLPPPDLVTVAAHAGFDDVGLRISPVTDDEQPWPMWPGSPMLAETVRRCADTGMRVLDVESIRLTPAPADYGPVLEAAAELGARYINTMCEDPDLARLSDTFAALVEAAAPYGVRPLIEFMAYRSVATLKDAATIASRSGGGGILIDALHVQRCGVGLDELTATDPGLFGYLQLCDAPLKAPANEIREARAGRLLPGDGQLPLRDLLDAMPAGIPVAVEAPRAVLWDTPAEFTARARRALGSVLSSQRSDQDVRKARGPRPDQALRRCPGAARRHAARGRR